MVWVGGKREDLPQQGRSHERICHEDKEDSQTRTQKADPRSMQRELPIWTFGQQGWGGLQEGRCEDGIHHFEVAENQEMGQ